MFVFIRKINFVHLLCLCLSEKLFGKNNNNNNNNLK